MQWWSIRQPKFLPVGMLEEHQQLVEHLSKPCWLGSVVLPPVEELSLYAVCRERLMRQIKGDQDGLRAEYRVAEDSLSGFGITMYVKLCIRRYVANA